MAVHFLWAYPKNRMVLARKFDVCDDYAYRKSHLWKWIRRISSLADLCIYWPTQEFSKQNAPTNLIWIDGVDKETWEYWHHETLSKDPNMYSHKHNHAGLRYQVCIAVHMSRVVDICGPYPAKTSEQQILEESGLLDKLPAGKLAVVDRGYINNKRKDKLSWPNRYDSEEVNNHKSRIRNRGETFNGRMHFFAIMSKTFTHNPEYHRHAFVAVATLVQYQMDNGSPLYTV